MSVSRIKKNDIVVASRGASAGKKGKVLQVLPSRGRIIVEGLNLRKKALRKSEDSPQGGITEKEASLSISKIMLYCPKCEKGVKILRQRDAARSIRKCKTCSHSFDN